LEHELEERQAEIDAQLEVRQLVLQLGGSTGDATGAGRTPHTITFKYAMWEVQVAV
jgi:hypothetical protein